MPQPFPDVCLQAGTQFETNIATRRATFGDGYTQHSLDGLNAIHQTFTARFIPLPHSEAEALRKGLEDSVATDTYWYTLAGQSTALQFEVEADGIRFDIVGPTHSSVSCKFRQVHA